MYTKICGNQSCVKTEGVIQGIKKPFTFIETKEWTQVTQRIYQSSPHLWWINKQTLHQSKGLYFITCNRNYFAKILDSFLRGWVPGGLMGYSENLRHLMLAVTFRRLNKEYLNENNSFKPMELKVLLSIRNIFYLVFAIVLAAFTVECSRTIRTTSLQLLQSFKSVQRLWMYRIIAWKTRKI